MKLEIVSPEKVYFSGDVALVTLPGKLGQFTVLENHAPIISLLSKGSVIYKTNADEQHIEIDGGFAEVNNNSIIVCVEHAK
jgi:F-type H+-transporting ATPase subunit epsilon